jgi:hypothetical protein
MSENDAPTSANPYTWRKRRRYLYILTAFCMLVIAYCLYMGKEDRVAETAVTMSYWSLIAFAGSYVFGAAWQDVSHMKATGGRE